MAMLVQFCLRLAVGLLACLLIVTPAQVNPRFYRTHFLVALGLTGLAIAFGATDAVFLATMSGGVVFALAGFFCWSLEGAPLGRVLIVATTAILAAGLVVAELAEPSEIALGWRLAADATSAALLGAATTAMLMGHMYLIAPGMSLGPLLRLLAALLAATLVRLLLAALSLWLWSSTGGHSLLKLQDETVLLPVRWGLGFVGPLVLGLMAWQTAKIRSTQSATGLLYVVVIFCFIGELTSQLLQSTTGYAL